jgi:hypothetical protein
VGYFRVKIPASAINDPFNPSFEGTTGFALTSATGGRNTTVQHSGAASCLVTPTAGTGYVTLTTRTLTNEARVMLAWAQGAITKLTVGATDVTPIPVEFGANGWVRWAATFTAAQCNGQTTCAVKSTTAFYVDDVLLYAGDASDGYPVYFDGDSGPGRRWLAGRYTSASKQLAWYQDAPVWDGGVIAPLDDNSQVGVELITGFGFPPVTVQSDRTASGRILYRETQLGARAARLNIWMLAQEGDDYELLTEIIADVERKIPLDRPFALLVDLGNTTQEARFTYTGGLQGSIDFREGTWSRQTLELEAQDPRFYDVTPASSSLTVSATPTATYIAVKEQGVWRGFSGGAGVRGPARVVYTAPDGTLYWGTENISGTAYVQKWDGETVSDVMTVTGSITAGPQVNTLAVSPDGLTLYIGGDYTHMDGTAGYNGVGKVTLATGAEAKVPSGGTGASGGAVLTGEIDPSGTYWVVGGNFTSINGVSASRFARMTLSGETWTAVASAAFGAAVRAVKTATNGDYFVGGSFDASSGFSTPAAPTVVSVTDASPGTMIPGYRYRYKRSILTALGESDASAYTEVTIQNPGGHSAADVSWSAAGGSATGYRIYRTKGYEAVLAPDTTNLTEYYFLAEVGLVTTYHDETHEGLDFSRIPPTVNLSGHRTPRVAWYDASAAAWRNWGRSGISGGDVYGLELFPDQQTGVAVGTMTACDGTACGQAAYIQGDSWLPLGVGLTGGTVHSVKRDQAGRVWAGGAHTAGDGSTLAAKLSRFDGFPYGVWQHVDIIPAGTVYSIATRQPDEIAIAHSSTTSSAAAGNTVTVTGTAAWTPQIIVTGPGTLRAISCYETGEELLFTHAFATNEQAVLDLTERTFVSNVAGDILSKVRPGSAFDTFHLPPGGGTVTVHMTGGGSVRLAGRPANVSIHKAAI